MMLSELVLYQVIGTTRRNFLIAGILAFALAGCESFGPMKRIRVEYQPKESYRYISELFVLMKNDRIEEIHTLSTQAKERGVIDDYKVYRYDTIIILVFTMQLNGKPFTTIITKDENGNVMARNYP